MIAHRLMVTLSIGILSLALLACKETIAAGTLIVKALESHKELKGRLPESLDELVSNNLLHSIPDSGIGKEQFIYTRFSPLDRLQYEISLSLMKPSIWLIDTNSWTELVFRSDGKYEGDKVEVHKFINGWDLQTVYK